jgi:hypothetical protein
LARIQLKISPLESSLSISLVVTTEIKGYYDEEDDMASIEDAKTKG